MKILYAFNRDLNPYVNVLVSGLKAAGCPVELGTETFWDAERFDHDIVHIQWPETLFDWRVPSAIEMTFLRRRLKEIHRRAILVFTRHNEVSHHANESNAAVLKDLYALCESECDVMIHLGEASRTACRARPELSGKRHEMIPIPVYDELYAPFVDMDQQEARRRLGIPQDRTVILAFGNFRYEKEKALVAEAFLGMKDRRACMVAPKWHKAREYAFSPLHPMLMLRSMRKAAWAWRNRMKLGAKKVITDEEVALHFAAADVVFIQRMDELNSGNVPMAFLFKKVVAGPDCGNIGDWCRATGNPVFDAKEPSAVQAALRKALELSETTQGEDNFQFAMDRWSTKRLGEEYAELYRSLHA